jgi:hypothetical protein
MAITKNPFLQDTSGTIGGLLVFRQYKDKTVVSKVPNMSNRVLSEKQKETNERMRLANIYAKYSYRTDEGKTKARDRLQVPAHKSLFHALVKEHLDLHKHLTLEQVKGTISVANVEKKECSNSKFIKEMTM